MYIYSNLQDVHRHPVMSYFKSEYKNDWEYEYNQFIAQRKSENSILKKLKIFFSELTSRTLIEQETTLKVAA